MKLIEIKDWLEHPEGEFERLKAERECLQRLQRLETTRCGAESREACTAVPEAGLVGSSRADNRGRLRERFSCA